jgi:hypothetical protein
MRGIPKTHCFISTHLPGSSKSQFPNPKETSTLKLQKVTNTDDADAAKNETALVLICGIRAIRGQDSLGFDPWDLEFTAFGNALGRK